MAHRLPVIAIDGPAGAGKSTVSKALAHQLGLQYLDTGAMYRSLALKAQRQGVDVNDAAAASALLEGTEITFGPGEPQAVFLDGEEVTGEIRQPEIGNLASTISAHSAVRRTMVARQQALVAAGGVVLEGRDATTVIAPDADLKLFMTASLEERAKRRQREFDEKGLATDYATLRNQISERDHRDITRDDSPLKVAEDATVVETAGLTVFEVVARIRALLVERGLLDG